MSLQHPKLPADRPLARSLTVMAWIAPSVVVTGTLMAQQPPSSFTPRSAVHALAHLEPQGGLVTIGARPGARILKIEVAEGDVVKAGAMLAILEGNEQARRQVELAGAQKKRARELRSRAREKARLERKQIDTMLDLRQAALKTQVEITEKKNATAQGLYTGLGAIGGLAKLAPKDQVELESALYLLQMQSIKTGLELKELSAKKELLAEQRKLEDEELKHGGAEDELLDRQIDLARSALDQTVVVAPSSGTILSVMARAGEVSNGPLLTLGDLSSIVARAEVDQADLGRIRVGDTARVMIIDDAVVGKVTRIGGQVGFNQMRSIDPRASQDIRVVRVTILLEKPELAARFVGMQVDVAIEPASLRPSEGAKSPDR